MLLRRLFTVWHVGLLTRKAERAERGRGQGDRGPLPSQGCRAGHRAPRRLRMGVRQREGKGVRRGLGHGTDGSPPLLLVKQVLISVRLRSPGRGCSQTPGRLVGVWPFCPRGRPRACRRVRRRLALAIGSTSMPTECQVGVQSGSPGASSLPSGQLGSTRSTALRLPAGPAVSVALPVAPGLVRAGSRLPSVWLPGRGMWTALEMEPFPQLSQPSPRPAPPLCPPAGP